MIVLDASATVEFLLGTDRGERVARRLLDASDRLHAPHLIDVEVAQVLRRLVASGEIASERGEEALTDLGDLPVLRHPHHPLLPRVWTLRSNLTAHDAVYVALAESLDAILLTLDGRLARARGHGARVDFVS